MHETEYFAEEEDLNFNDRFWVFKESTSLGYILPEYNWEKYEIQYRKLDSQGKGTSFFNLEEREKADRRDCLWVTAVCLNEILSLTEIMMAGYDKFWALFYSNICNTGPYVTEKPEKVCFQHQEGLLTVDIDQLSEEIVIYGSTTLVLDRDRLNCFEILSNPSTGVSTFHGSIGPSLKYDMENFVTQAVRIQRALAEIGKFSDPAKLHYEMLHGDDSNNFPDREE